jgi:hypothetical protein
MRGNSRTAVEDRGQRGNRESGRRTHLVAVGDGGADVEEAGLNTSGWIVPDKIGPQRCGSQRSRATTPPVGDGIQGGGAKIVEEWKPANCSIAGRAVSSSWHWPRREEAQMAASTHGRSVPKALTTVSSMAVAARGFPRHHRRRAGGEWRGGLAEDLRFAADPREDQSWGGGVRWQKWWKRRPDEVALEGG